MDTTPPNPDQNPEETQEMSPPATETKQEDTAPPDAPDAPDGAKDPEPAPPAPEPVAAPVDPNAVEENPKAHVDCARNGRK